MKAMKSFRKEIEFRTEGATDIIEMTGIVGHAVRESGIEEGLALVFPLHTSSAVYLSDSDLSLTQDFADLLETLVPRSKDYRHDAVDYKRNAAAHLKAILAGHSVMLPVSRGRLDLGTYQTLYYFEFDGGRSKEVLVKIIGE